MDGWGFTLNGLMSMVVVGGLIITAIYYAMQRLVVPKIPSLRNKKKKVKAKMSVSESFKFLAASPYIRDLALLVSVRVQRNHSNGSRTNSVLTPLKS